MKELKEKAFFSWEVARFHLNFPNGNQISTVFGEGTYSEEKDSRATTDYILQKTKVRPLFNSNNCEIMIECPPKLLRKIEKKYNEGAEQPIGYLPLDKWLEIVNLLAK